MHHGDDASHIREINDAERMRELNDGESIGQGSIGTQGDSAPHNMSANHRQVEGKVPKYKDSKD